MRKECLKQFFFEKTGIKRSIYSRCYDKNALIYIHIPKAAGTSICEALYGEDPWHFNSKEINLINTEKFSKYSKVSFTRNPLERLISTYNYSKSHIKKNPKTSISFLNRCESFDMFVSDYLTKELIDKHYFFWTQDRYLDCNLDFLGKFENIQNDFQKLSLDFGLNINLEKKNVSVQPSEVLEIKHSSLLKIQCLYSDDFKRFDYECISDKIIVL